MKRLFFLVFAFIASTSYAGTDYTGIWKDNQGVFYSIHQANESIIVGELLNRFTQLSPGEQGSIYLTNNDLNMAILGHGYFILKNDDGSYTYTRNGNFYLSGDSFIVNDKGERLVTEKQLPIPLDQDAKSEKQTATPLPLPCNTVSGCPPETRLLIIDPDGSISLRYPRTGEVVKFDRIVLASIPVEQINFSGYPIRSENVRDQKSIAFFYPNPSDMKQSHNASIQQEVLEELSYDMKTWNGYIGRFIGNKASLAVMPESNSEHSNPPSKEIIFDSSSTATITNGCNAPRVFCESNIMLQDRHLTKVY